EDGALANAVLLPDDLHALLESKGVTLNIERTWETYYRVLGGDCFPEGTYLYLQAAHEIAQEYRWGKEREDSLKSEMASAINAGQLPTYDRHTGLRIPIGHIPEFMGLVTVQDVNNWLRSRGAGYIWERTDMAEQAPDSMVLGNPLPNEGTVVSGADDREINAWSLNRPKRFDALAR